MPTAMAAIMPIIMAFRVKIVMTRSVVDMVAVADVSTRVVIVMAGVVPVIMRPSPVLRVVRTSRTIHNLVTVSVPMRIANVQMHIPPADVDSKSSESVCCLRRIHIEANQRQCC